MRYKIPAKFWDDFADRCPCDGDPEVELPKELSRSGNRVLIEGNDSQIEWLRSDAAYYCHRWGPDEQPPGLKISAAATIRALAAPLT